MRHTRTDTQPGWSKQKAPQGRSPLGRCHHFEYAVPRSGYDYEGLRWVTLVHFLCGVGDFFVTLPSLFVVFVLGCGLRVFQSFFMSAYEVCKPS